MKKILIWILVLTLIAVASAVATIAYFMYDTPLEENTMTVGNASIELVEYQRGADGAVDPFVNDKILIPSTIADGFEYDAVNYDPKKITADTPCVDWGSIKEGYKSPIWDSANINDEVDKMVFVRNKGNTNVYVRVCFAFEAGNYVWLSHFDRMVHLNKNDKDWTWSWKNDVVEINGTRYFIAWATYNHVLPAGEYTNISLSQIALDVSAISDHARAFGEKYEVMAFAQGIQAHGFTDVGASAALNENFGETIPFKNVKEVKFVDLPTALHSLNGKNETSFVGKSNDPNTMVSSITFGLTADHAAKVVGCEGVLTANREADSSDYTAYTYYILNSDGQYDIYVLADAWEIYAPKYCEKLFGDMAGIKKIDITNLNVSQATTMKEWFNRCKALETIDVSDWDVSNVTNMQYLFNQCGKLANIDVSDWDVGNVTYMNYMFRGCPITTLDVADWDVSKVTDMGEMFWQCGSLTNLDLSTWKTDSLTNIYRMFQGCGELTDLNISTWDVSKVTNMSALCSGCDSLPYLDISQWILNQEENANVNMSSMFVDCFALIEVDLPKEGTGRVTDMSSMFYGCHKLASLDISQWNTSLVTNMSFMFLSCKTLTELDLSGWNTANVEDSESMFDGCESLETIYVSDSWTMSKVVYKEISDKERYSSYYMFKNCTNLPNYNPSVVDKTNAHTGEGGYLTDIKDKPANP